MIGYLAPRLCLVAGLLLTAALSGCAALDWTRPACR